MADMAVASVAVCSLSNRLSALAGVMLLTELSLLTVEVELIELVELSGCIIICGLEGETLDLVASVNSVDLDAAVAGALVVFIGNCVWDETSVDKKIIQVVELGV